MERGQFFQQIDQQLAGRQTVTPPATPVVASDRQAAIANLPSALDIVDDYAVLLAQRGIEMQVSSDIEALECRGQLPLAGSQSIGVRLMHDDQDGWIFAIGNTDTTGKRTYLRAPGEVRIDRDWHPQALEELLQRLIARYLVLRDLPPNGAGI